MADNFVNGFHGMREFHGTFGDLMDTANRTGDDASKDFLRKCFQGWCQKNGKNMWDAATVMEWRSLPFTTYMPE